MSDPKKPDYGYWDGKRWRNCSMKWSWAETWFFGTCILVSVFIGGAMLGIGGIGMGLWLTLFVGVPLFYQGGD